MHQCVIRKIGKDQNWGGTSLVITIFLYFKLNIILKIIQKQQFYVCIIDTTKISIFTAIFAMTSTLLFLKY